MPKRSLAELTAVLAPEMDGVVARAAARAKREMSVYESISEREIREGIARDLGAGIASVVEERTLSNEERAAMGTIGDARARQGVPLEAMLRVYRLTFDELFQVVWKANEDGRIDPEEVTLLTREIWRSADASMDLAVAAYRHRELELAVADTERRSALLHALLFSPAGAPDSLVTDAGLDPAAAYIAFRARPGAGRTETLMLDLRAPGVLEHGATGMHGEDIVGFSLTGPHLAAGDGDVIGVGPAGPLHELPRSFAIASRVVDTAAAYARSGVLRLADVAVPAIAQGEDALGDLLVERFVDVVEPRTAVGAEMLQTVRAHMACELSAERTAEVLGVHPNTVRNRLHRYESLTGANLRGVDDLVLVRLALLRFDAR